MPTFLRLLLAIGWVWMAVGPAGPWSRQTRGQSPAIESRPTPEEQEFFARDVLPILRTHCFRCHGAEEELRGNLRLTSRRGLMAGGDLGPAVSLDRPDDSLLLKAINYDELEMPPTGKLPPEKIEILTRWVRAGIPWQAGTEQESASTPKQGIQKKGPPPVDDEARRFWSFQPLVRPALPAPPDGAWVKTPVDAFILSRLNQAGLRPAPPASPAALLRRAYYDLIGLPPSPEAVQAFVSDPSPAAFSEIVDRLLESPQYGERWGRHWLDLVRYAESNSYERDGPKPEVWRYRDYVIRALNDDKPYDQFILEQLAGDELDVVGPDQRIATGYYRLGIWQDEPVDPVQELYEDLDDIVGTTAQVFLGLTLNCARCHDHKLDPLPQRDYYRFLAFFHGINRYGERSEESVARFSLREVATTVEKQQQQAAIANHETQLRQVEQHLATLEALVVDDFQPVEKENFRDAQLQIPIVQKRVGRLISDEQFQQYAELQERRRQLREFKPQALAQALCITEQGPEPRETFVLVRGNARNHGERVEPGWPAVLAAPDPVIAPAARGETSGRRIVLARWIAHRDNPLTARVMVNRIWQYHFGRGLVRSASNFGYQGDPPTHPELLDWLAAEFIDGGWRLKRLHKLIMLSQTYQMSSQADPVALAQDPQNDRFWRFDMRRLEAEEVRDSVLAITGQLNPKMYGPSIYPLIADEVLAGQSQPGANWGASSVEEQSRRSIYIHVKRSLPVPLIAAFDGVDADASCPVRFVTTQATQALGMLNGEFLNEQARHFAESLKNQAGADRTAQVRWALKRALQRQPHESEIGRGLKLLTALEQEHAVQPDLALAQFCLVVLNLNESVYLD